MTAEPPPPPLTDGPVLLRAHEGGFVIDVNGAPVGHAGLEQVGCGTARIWCELQEEHRGHGYAVRAVRLLTAYAFGELALARVEAYAVAGDRAALRLANRAGLQREGLLRGQSIDGEGGRQDVVLLARLADDPPAGTGAMFRAALNAGLPRKRTIAQAIIRNERGEVLLAELVYKRYWDLPGGVVDPGESPATAVVREVAEELGVDASVRALAVVSWLPPWQGWDDAMLYLFDVAAEPGDLARAVLEPREIRAVHWADAAAVRERCAPYTARLVERALELIETGGPTAYLENGEDPGW